MGRWDEAIGPVLRPDLARFMGRAERTVFFSRFAAEKNTHKQKMKRTLLTTLLTLFAAAAFAQGRRHESPVVDADTGESVVRRWRRSRL